MISYLITGGGIIVGIILFIILFKAFWRVAGTNEVLIVSGLGKVKTKTGGGLFVLPILQKVQRMTLENIQVDFISKNEIPTQDAIHLSVDAVANMAISQDPERQRIAATKFAGYTIDQIREIIIPVLEGNIREIISQTDFESLIKGDKKKLSELVMENVTPNLADLGIDLTTFNIQNFSDKNGVIRDLGIENIKKIQKDAQIAAAKAESEVQVAKAEADKRANDAKVAAALEIAKKQNDFAVRKAELQVQADTEQAKADAAKKIEAENQRKAQEIAVAEANLAKQEKELELKEREVAIKEKALDADVRKTAEAQKFAEQQRADAMLYAKQKASEAELFEREKKAEAERIEAEKQAEAIRLMAQARQAEGEAEANASKAKGLAEAEAIRAKAEAEAEGMLKKAEAMERYGESARMNMQIEALKVYFSQLPEIAKAVGDGYQGVDKIVMLGNDSNQLAGNILNTTTQISESLSESLGIDVKALLSGVLGGKIAQN